MLRGCDDLRGKLQAAGFRTFIEAVHKDSNECNWYAARRMKPPYRHCELNEENFSLFVRPFAITMRPYGQGDEGVRYETVEIGVIGQSDGIWFDLKAYSVPIDEALSRLDDIEGMIGKAWNGLSTGPKPPARCTKTRELFE